MSADLSEAFGSEVVLLSAADDAALVEKAGRLAHFLEQAPAAIRVDAETSRLRSSATLEVTMARTAVPVPEKLRAHV